jgi:hypothetical protein
LDSLETSSLDRDGSDRDCLVDRFNNLCSVRILRVVVGRGVRAKIQHPRTPSDVQHAIEPQIFNLRAGLNEPQRIDWQRVYQRQGKARPGKHAADASHLSEAAETGCGYFITHDNRILNKRDELHTALPPTLTIVTLQEFFGFFDDYETGKLI